MMFSVFQVCRLSIFAATGVIMRQDRYYALLSSLPAMMLLAGLTFYFSRQSAELDGELVLEEMVELSGVYEGVSAASPGSSDSFLIWIDTGQRKRGIKVLAAEVDSFREMSKGETLQIQAAPRVAGSRSLWLYRLYDSTSVSGGGSSIRE